MTRPRLWLGIETTGPQLGVAVHDAASREFPCLGRFFEPRPGQQAELLFPTIDHLLKQSRLRRSDVAAVAVDHGPGSFTGVRIGVASARAVAQSLHVPLIGVSSLEAIAWEAALRAPGEAVVAARIPALAAEAYFAVFEKDARNRWKVLKKPAWITEAVIEKELARIAKDGGHLADVPRKEAIAPLPKGLAIHSFLAPDPSFLLRLALALVGPRPSRAKYSVEKVVPIYLQPSWAERKRPAPGGRP